MGICRWEDYQFVLPRTLIEDVLQDLHSSVIAGHLRMAKTLQKVQKRFYWVGKKEYV